MIARAGSENAAAPITAGGPMPHTIDLVVAVLIAIAYPIWDHVWGWPRMLRAIQSARPDARVPVYREVIAQEWGITAVIVGLWLRAGRPWSALGLLPPTGWRLGVAVALVAALLWLIRVQLTAVARLDAAKRARTRTRSAALGPIIPHTRAEHAWFRPLAVTAGICEELIYRGFLVWALRPWLGLWGAASASVVSFGFAHAYQGRRHALNAGITGGVLAVIAIVTGSVVPGMILHALVDLLGGETSYAIFRDDADASAAA
jgi:CAAX protease family protein